MSEYHIEDFLTPLEKDAEIFSALSREYQRQEGHLELIASENYASVAVMQAQGSILTNKYAEGYPGKRYYGGCEFVDQVETIAINRLKKLFGVSFANVQPHSGSQANQGVYTALLSAGDTILGMDLSSGGHLTHGSKVNLSGKLYNAITYGVNQNGFLDYDHIRSLAIEHKPKLIIAGASAYSRKIDWEIFSQIAKEVGAYFMTDIAHYSGLIAAGLYPSPIEFADAITSTTHKTLRGPRGGIIMTNNEVLTRKFDSAIFPGIQGGPLEHVIAAKAVCFGEALQPSFKDYAQKTIANAKAMALRFQEHGYKIVSGGTDCHMFLLDLSSIEVKGNVAQEVLDKAGITVNKNGIPNDKEKPSITSGIRIGTPALTTRGLGIKEVKEIVDLIDAILTKKITIEHASGIVGELSRNYPVYNTRT
jgi:glycine hydroxymethyltransferase